MDHLADCYVKSKLHTFWKPKAVDELLCGERGILIFTVSQILNKISPRLGLVLCAVCHIFIDNLHLSASRYEYYTCIF